MKMEVKTAEDLSPVRQEQQARRRMQEFRLGSFLEYTSLNNDLMLYINQPTEHEGTHRFLGVISLPLAYAYFSARHHQSVDNLLSQERWNVLPCNESVRRLCSCSWEIESYNYFPVGTVF